MERKTKLRVLFLLCVSCNLLCHAEVADVRMVFVHVNAINEIIPLDEPSDLVPVINYHNNGPDDITEANGTDLNFNIKAYLSSDPDKREADASFALSLGFLGLNSQIEDELRKKVLVGHSRGLTLDGVNIEIPSDSCEQVDYFCVEAVLVKDGFTDPDLNNNIYCAKFDLPLPVESENDNIGIFKCYIDIENMNSLVTAPADITYLAGTAETVTFQSTIQNNGGITLAQSVGNFALKPEVYLTDSGQFETATVKVLQGAIAQRYTDDVAPDTNMTLATFNADILLPTDNAICSQITHICVVITKDVGNYTDYDEDNNDYCFEFGSVADGKAGVIYGCPIDGIDLQIQSFEVRDWETTIYDIGADNTITVDAVIVNIGDDAISASANDGPDNYAFEVHLSNHRDDLDTLTVPCDMDLGGTTNLKSGLAYGDSLDTNGAVATCTLPADTNLCLAYQSVCLKVVQGPNAPYTETVTDNNVVCQEFGDMVGNKSCPKLDIDLQPTQVTFTPSQEPYPLDTNVPTDIAVRVTNAGPGHLPEADDPNVNFVVSVWLSDGENIHILQNPHPPTINVTQLRQGLDADGVTDILVSATNVLIPEDSCEQMLYLCVTVSLDDNSIYTDEDPSNDKRCVEFGPTAEGKAGETECFVDINATAVEVRTPTDLTYKPGFETDIVILLSVTNEGGLAVDQAEDGHNFVAVVYLTNDADINQAMVKLPATVTSDGFTNRIPGRPDTPTLPTTSVKVTMPIVKATCEELTHFCVELTHDEAKYVDVDPSNDFVCIEFGPVAQGYAGVKTCDVSVDLSADDLIVSPEVPTYDFDVDTNAHISITVTDNGAGDLPEAVAPAVNYEVTAYLTNNAEFEDASYKRELPNLNLDAASLRRAISNGEEISLDTESATIHIPLDECTSISHICLYVTVSNSDTSVFNDPDLTNNDDCLDFGLVGDGKAGVIPCFIDIAAIRLRVVEPANPRYPAGQDTDLLVELTVHNYGALSLPHAPDDKYNFRPVIYLTNSGNLDRATRVIQQAVVETTMVHEVASSATVSLPDFTITVVVPEDADTCQDLTHICLRIDHNEEVYIDGYEPNDKTCMAFDPICVGEESPADERTRGLPIEYTIIIIVVVIVAVLIGVTVALCNGCKKRSPKYLSA